jgi:hypothetical protein
VCWKPCSSCWSLHLLREEFLSAPIHSPSLVRHIGLSGITSGSGVAARWRGESIMFPLGSKAGATTEGMGSSFSPWWSRAVVQASVKKGGAATTAGPAPPTGGSGLHGKRRPHGRPPTPPPLFSFSPSSPSSAAVWIGEESSPDAARVGSTSGGCGAATNRRGAAQDTWTAGMQRRPCAARPRFGTGISKRGKGEVDDDDVSAGPTGQRLEGGARLVAAAR